MPADLHIHSTASDGLLPPAEIVKRAKALSLDLVALTDHDTTDGIQEAYEAGRKYSVQVITGIELSSEDEDQEIHILGYMFERHYPGLQSLLRKLKSARMERIRAITELLGKMGFPISWEEVVSAAQDASSIGRPHIARVMVDKGYAASIGEVFSRWIGPDGPAFVGRYKITPDQAISMIHAAGGLAFLAHPGLLQGGLNVAGKLVSLGLDGVEAFHFDHDSNLTREVLNFAARNGLFVSGGSDCHGDPLKMGQCSIELDYLSWL